MTKLNNELLNGTFKFPSDLKVSENQESPEKVLQFGEGNFLRGFVDWMFHQLNKNNLFNGKIAVVQPIQHGLVDMLNDQDGLYTLFLRGIQNGKVVEDKEIISSISRGINPYSQFDEYLKCAENPELRVIISNTTEAGIAYNADEKFEDTPPASFPGKLTVLLHKRFKAFNGDASKGLIIIPCELIDRNGDNLKKIVLQLANEWNLGSNFISWIENANYFLNTLVDRIVTGYPRDEVQKLTEELGYQDNLLDTAEIFHLWVIEGDKKLSEEIPFTKIGLNVIWTDDMTPYRTRKVRILNGAHTMTVLAAYLHGKDTVKECMDDDVISKYMNNGIFNEIIPTLDLPKAELEEFAAAVSERFANPFIKHYLLSIALNSTSKFKTRVLPSILEYIKRKNELPKTLTFSLAALLAFYKGTEINENALMGQRSGNEYKIMDDMPVLELFKKLWSDYDETKEGTENLVKTVLSNTDMWGTDLTGLDGFTSTVSGYLYDILTIGVNEAIKKIL
ncbi:tagaturonate reductase [Petroclostridium sp. X23]|uniref:tagaturonate reductase n=1 Tax=Petroclostridium sp. X23 TaxID=3045146 RepID=UPI0024ADA05F|nr:tagaturonate reductase [Petroclostridium sp. X23]WHH60290.1 tagaturonate reductase [Petroclostridium sp. X23]